MFILVSIKYGFLQYSNNRTILIYLKRNYHTPSVKFASLDCHIVLEASLAIHDLSVCCPFLGKLDTAQWFNRPFVQTK